MILELGCASKDEKVVFRLLFLNRVDPKFQLSSEDSYKHCGWLVCQCILFVEWTLLQSKKHAGFLRNNFALI